MRIKISGAAERDVADDCDFYGDIDRNLATYCHGQSIMWVALSCTWLQTNCHRGSARKITLLSETVYARRAVPFVPGMCLHSRQVRHILCRRKIFPPEFCWLVDYHYLIYYVRQARDRLCRCPGRLCPSDFQVFRLTEVG